MFIAVAGIVMVGFWFLLRQSRRHGSAPFVLSALPLALLFLITPVPLIAVQSVRAFQSIGARNNPGVKDAVFVALGIARPLWLGGVGFLVAMCGAAGLQVATRLSLRSEESSPYPDAAQPKSQPDVEGARTILLECLRDSGHCGRLERCRTGNHHSLD